MCVQELAGKEGGLAEVAAEYEAFKAAVAKVRTVEVELCAQIEDAAKAFKENGKKVKHWAERLAELRASASDNAHLLGEIGEADGEGQSGLGELPDLSESELGALDADDLGSEISQLEGMIEGMDANLTVIGEYRKREAEVIPPPPRPGRARAVQPRPDRAAPRRCPIADVPPQVRAKESEYNAMVATRDAARAEYEALRTRRYDEFMAGFGVIGTRLKEMYQMITLGGDAELELVDSLDPFSEGVVFSVRPPKKSWKHIANLSGGEKTLSSLALVFALHHYKPTPLYVMDEIDAALDFRNVSIVANYIKEQTTNAQFIIISLRNNMFELADRLVGIYKTHNATKSVAIDPAAFTIAAR